MFAKFRSGSRFSTMETWDVVGVLASFLSFLVLTGGVTTIYGTDLTTIAQYSVAGFSLSLPVYLGLAGITSIIVTNTITAQNQKEVTEYFDIQAAEGASALFVIGGVLALAFEPTFLVNNVIGQTVAGSIMTVAGTVASVIAGAYPY